ncbi:MAG: RNA polymerase sigma factor [Gammaproteobacteria bacterium]
MTVPRRDEGQGKETGLATDTAALERFLADVERRALGMARLATGDPEEALDAVQDAMFRFARRYGNRPEQQWKPLFFKVLVNRIRDGHRRRAVRLRHTASLADDGRSPDPLDRVAGHPAEEPDAAAEASDAMEALGLALERLPPRQQEAFMLRCLEGLDVRTTARAMGCSEGSVKTHYFRALAVLREELEDYR